MSGLPREQGLYHPGYEHDACGIGFIAHLKGKASHEMVEKGLAMLCRMEHRGALGSEPDTGDGAGIMVRIPHAFMQRVWKEAGLDLPQPGEYAIGMFFLPQEREKRAALEALLETIVHEEGQRLRGWRTVPVDPAMIGIGARESQPFMRQVLIERGEGAGDPLAFERRLYVIRKRWEREAEGTGYVASLSSRTLVYKGMLTPSQLECFYPDLLADDFASPFAVVHSRFSTNTFPSWERAHPNRYLIHNGEINTLQGNINWLIAREKQFVSEAFGEDLGKVLPILNLNGSDSSMLDNCFEFLVLSGRSLAEAAMMLVPEPWEGAEMDEEKKAFYAYHSCLQEPWDGPAAIAFTDGHQIGATLDRNGLRPARYYVTADDTVVFASEVGVLPIPEEKVLYKGRLSPGRMLLVDLDEGRIIADDEVKARMAAKHPYRQWLKEQMLTLEQLPEAPRPAKLTGEVLLRMQQALGFTQEELNKQLLPMITEGKDPVGSMGLDKPLAVLSERPQLLYDYFKQSFAQVTNPPIDALREECVTSTLTWLGAEGNWLKEEARNCRRIRLASPLLSDADLARLRHNPYPEFKAQTLSLLFPADEGEQALERALEELFAAADRAIAGGHTLLILSDRGIDRKHAAIPALLAVSGLHHHLVRQGTRTRASLLVESAEPRDVHQFAMLIGYGADAINPYLMTSVIEGWVQEGKIPQQSAEEAVQRYLETAIHGVVKVMSKMGISTIQSYRGAQIFEAVGISSSVIDRYFTRTSSQVGGISLETIACETLLRHQAAYAAAKPALEAGSDFQWRRDGEYHAFHPQAVHALQRACREGDYELYKEYTRMVYDRPVTFLRDLLTFKAGRKPVPLDEVEPVEAICRRFKTGAMSYGALSQEAHEALAIAMNRLGGKSNSGEGGEDPRRYTRDENGDSRSSAIKQVASGRFGVTSHYLTQAVEIQIKMAQGAKPGEGGQLPGKKVYPWIAEVRGSTPGVSLISPPPHHDIYSIEDLAQLIYDLKNANPRARISVKLVAKAGVGTIAAGVAKGLADVIVISGHDGGTGASPRTSIKHAGMPWELGLAETHQTLMLNRLRDRVVLETDGKLMNGRDVVIAALLGAEEFGFSTAPLVALGCVMARVCHRDTCPTGIATQNPELRKRFKGDPQHVVNFMRFIAQEVREWMAQLGFRTLEEMVGRSDLLQVSERAASHWKARELDLAALLYQPSLGEETSRTFQRPQQHKLEETLDSRVLLPLCRRALEERQPVQETLPILNIDRAVGTLLGHEVTRRFGAQGLPDDTIRLHFQGSAGQSFGAFLPRGIFLSLEGDANDYVGKGLSGGKIAVYPCEESPLVPEENVIIGNVALYGATGGEAYIRGRAGERFAVRNSGALAVAEGVGDHGCEYMTGGRVVILGPVGKNFAAGMSGGIAYVLAEDKDRFAMSCNREMVLLESLEDEEEIALLKGFIENHVRYTMSRYAQEILDQWNEKISQFVKVIPKDYKRMTETIRQLERSGMTHQEAALVAFNQYKDAEEQGQKEKNALTALA